MLNLIRILAVLIVAVVHEGCVPSTKNANTFTRAGLQSGSIMTEGTCQFEDTSVWVVVSNVGECIRYFHSRLKDKNPIVHIWFHGDHLSTHWSGQVGAGTITHTSVLSYKNSSPGILQQFASREYKTFGIPNIRFSRPGVYGSSGDHNQRRRPRNIEIINVALDALKKKYNIGSFILSGQSGGGHVVASLLAFRSDIACAVITSGSVAVKERITAKGWLSDVTGYSDYYDPLEHVKWDRD